MLWLIPRFCGSVCHVYNALPVQNCGRQLSAAAMQVLDTRKEVKVLESSMSYLDTLVGDNAVLFFHGNPTSAYLWRNIIPYIQPVARCLAPDLIGMGCSDKEPNLAYKFTDHYRYMSTWIDTMDLPDKLTIVCHDWGSGLGFHWCNLNRDRVQSIVFMEAIVSALPSWNEFPEVARNIFQAFRTDRAEELILKKNFFVEKLLPLSIMRKLTDEEMAEYRRPFLEEGECRRPTLTWPQEIPVTSEGPQNVVDLVNAYQSWLMISNNVPKLFIDAEPGFFSSGGRKVVAKWPNVKTVKVKGLHFVQEDSPDEIGQEIAAFLTEVYKEK